MPAYHVGVSEQESSAPPPPADRPAGREPVNRFAHLSGALLDHSDAINNGIIHHPLPQRAYHFSAPLSLHWHRLCDAGVLSIGARLTVEKLDTAGFTRAMIELGPTRWSC
jgi:hypothetical protein